MKKRNKVKPGDKRNISFPLDINQEFLDYLNSHNNFSGILIKLAFDSFKNLKLNELENRVKKLEDKIGEITIKSDESLQNVFIDYDEERYYDMKLAHSLLSPDDEDDKF